MEKTAFTKIVAGIPADTLLADTTTLRRIEGDLNSLISVTSDRLTVFQQRRALLQKFLLVTLWKLQPQERKLPVTAKKKSLPLTYRQLDSQDTKNINQTMSAP